MLIELDPVERITTDAMGPPGQRVFYLQARGGGRLVTLVLEKQQVQLLAASVVEILSRVGKETGQGPPEEEMGLEEPIVPEWRAGRLSVGYQEERDLIVLEAEELLPEDEEDQEGGSEGAGEPAAGEEPWLGRFDPGGLTPEDVPLEDPGSEPEAEREPSRVRMWATREQMLSLARQGAAVSARGRPRCPLCGNPMGPEDHRCPALNGHGETRT